MRCLGSLHDLLGVATQVTDDEVKLSNANRSSHEMKAPKPERQAAIAALMDTPSAQKSNYHLVRVLSLAHKDSALSRHKKTALWHSAVLV
jgi:hypothetical protein